MARFMKFFKKLNNGFKLIRIDIPLFLRVFRNRKERAKLNSEKKFVSQTIEDIEIEIGKNKFKKILVISDEQFYRTINKPEWAHISFIYDGLIANDNNFDINTFDVIVIGGLEVKAVYIFIIKLLNDLKKVKPVLWVGNNFEFAGSTIAIIEEIEDANIYLFNHFGSFFSVKDPILVKYRIIDDLNYIENYEILDKNQSLRLNLREKLPNQTGTALIEFSTTHPLLTKGRHNRWRLWADVFFKESFASSHGSHDFTLPHTVSTRIAKNVIKKCEITYTLPNYNLDLSKSNNKVIVLSGTVMKSYIRSEKKRVDRIDEMVTRISNDNLGVMYIGAGDSFLYIKNNTTLSDIHPRNIMLNHNCSQNIYDNVPEKLSSNIKQKLINYKKKNILLHPHALPVLDLKDNIDFGFSFDGCNPDIRFFKLHIFDNNGIKIHEVEYEKKVSGYLYARDILGDYKKDECSLIIIEPDFVKLNFSPINFHVIGDLVVRNLETDDHDFTEFQSCWRNLGLITPELPHWLANYKLLNSTTQLVGKLENNEYMESFIILANASGNLKYNKKAIANIVLFSDKGDSYKEIFEVFPFTTKKIYVKDVLKNSTIPVNSFYSCVIHSSNADLNAQIVTSAHSGGISLQHLWGY